MAETIAEATQDTPQTRLAPTEFRTPTDADMRACRVEFIQGKASGPELAAKHGFSRHTVHAWIQRNGWQALKDKREAQELARLDLGLLPSEPVTEPTKSQIATLRAHLARIDSALETSDDAKDIAQLTRARGEIADQLYTAIHGTRIPSASARSKPSRSSQPTPQPAFTDPQAGEVRCP